VEQGEELTISYSRLDRGVPRRLRRAHLKECFHFDCWCESCDKSKEEIEKEELEVEKLKEMEREEQRMEEEQFLSLPHCSYTD
jgi:hypothetical protein